MALDIQLKEIYSSNAVDVQAYDTVELSHPNFTQTYYLVDANEAKSWKLEDDSEVVFEPFVFTLSLPQKGSNQQELGLVFDNVAQIGIMELERASDNIEIPITMKYRVYIDETYPRTPKSDVIVLSLKNVSATAKTITATASRANLYARKVPKRTFDSWIFKGLL